MESDRDHHRAARALVTARMRALKASRFRARIAKLFLVVLGLSTSAASYAAAEELADARLEIEQRVVIARDVLNSGIRAQQDRDDTIEVTLPDKIAQWSNWPNWGNWGNWPNWPNWGNWFNR